jgi:hypothetical protein
MLVIDFTDAAIDDVQWRRRIVTDVLTKLANARIAKTLCAQLTTKVTNAHNTFATSITKLHTFHTSRFVYCTLLKELICLISDWPRQRIVVYVCDAHMHPA